MPHIIMIKSLKRLTRKKEDGKTHLNNPTVQQPTGGEGRKPTNEELRWFKILNKGKSEDEYIKYMNKEK